MPTYGYQASDPEKSCAYCRQGFEVVQRISELPIQTCSRCGNAVWRIPFAPVVMVKGSPLSETDRQIREYEREGKWSHAAELADKEAEKTRRDDLKSRALEDYKKAGYDFSGNET